MKELIGDILHLAKFKSAVYFKYGFCSSWGMAIPKGDYSQFHLVTSGNCLLFVDHKTIPLAQGDIVIFPHGHPHQIKDSTATICQPGLKVVTDIWSGKAPYSEGAVNAHLICGHYEMNHDLSHPIFKELPEHIIIKSTEYGRFDIIHNIIELIIDEMTNKHPGYEIISLRFAEVLFISILRHYYLHQSKKTNNLFKDKIIYHVVNFIHEEIGSNLNIEVLSRQAGLSRTLFISRFKSVVGETPLKYIKNWRMLKAKSLLASTELSLLEIGEFVGYPSVPSFNRVFKQSFDISPGRFRQKASIN